MLSYQKISAAFLSSLFFSLLPLLAYGQEEEVEREPLYVRICEFRLEFCGAGGIAFVTAAVITLGFLFLTAKVKWPTVLIILTGIVIFASAGYMAEMIVTPPSGSAVITACQCS